jgi:hypothetical protein
MHDSLAMAHEKLTTWCHVTGHELISLISTLDGAATFIAIREEPTHHILPLESPRTTEGLPRPPLQLCPEREVLAFDRLQGAFAHGGLFQREITLGGPPYVCIIVGNTHWGQEGFTCQEGRVGATAHDIRHHIARVVIKRVPQLSCHVFVADNTPHLVEFSLSHSRTGRLTPLFPGVTHGDRAAPEDSRNIADPTAVQRQVHHPSSHLRQALLVRQQTDMPGTVWVLTPIA